MNKLKLSQKAFILVSLPLIFQVVFVYILMSAWYQAETEATRAETAQEIFSRGTILTKDLIQAAQSLYLYRRIARQEFLESYQQSSARIPGEFAQLKRCLKAKPQELPVATRLERSSQLAIAFMHESMRYMRLGEEERVTETLKQLERVSSELYSGLKQLIGPYESIGAEASALQRAARKTLGVSLIAWLVLNMALAIGLTIFFNRGTTMRLSSLMDNIRRFKSGSALTEPIGGHDEIFELDQNFREMAATIAAATEELKEKEMRIRAVIEGLPVGVFVVNQHGQVQFANTTAADLFRCDALTLSERKFSELLDLDGTHRGGDASEESLLQGCIGKIKEFTAVRTDSTTLPVEISISRFTGQGDGGYLVGIQDITQRRELEAMKQEFVNMVSHDLRSPLTSIKLFLDLLSQGVYGQLAPEAERKTVREAANCERLVTLLNELLEIDKLEAGQVDLELHLVPAIELLQMAASSVSTLAHMKGVSLVVHDTPLEVVADSDRIVQVLVNLVSNAIKFSPRDSAIELSAVSDEAYVQMRVKDQGRGIPADKIDLVFERFKQVKRDDARKLGGAGLGLAICKALVEAHKGRIGVESIEGQGSTFWFTLPTPVPELDAVGASEESE